MWNRWNSSRQRVQEITITAACKEFVKIGETAKWRVCKNRWNSNLQKVREKVKTAACRVKEMGKTATW